MFPDYVSFLMTMVQHVLQSVTRNYYKALLVLQSFMARTNQNTTHLSQISIYA